MNILTGLIEGTIISLITSIGLRRLWVAWTSRTNPCGYKEYEECLAQERQASLHNPILMRLILAPIIEELGRAFPLLMLLTPLTHLLADALMALGWGIWGWIWALSHVWQIKQGHFHPSFSWQDHGLRRWRVITFSGESASYVLSWVSIIMMAPTLSPIAWGVFGWMAASIAHGMHNYGIGSPRRFGMVYRRWRYLDRRHVIQSDPSKTP